MRTTCLIVLGVIVAGIGWALFSDSEAEKTAAAREKWLATKRKLEAAGIVFDLEKLVPPPVPDEENFAAHRLVAETYSKAAREDSSSTTLGKVDLRSLPEFPKRRFSPSRPEQHLYDLAKDTGKQDLDRDAAAKMILEGVGNWDRELDALVEAAARPACRFPIDWDNATNEIASSVPFSATKHLAWRALCNLQLGESAAARRDTIALLQLSRHSGSNPSLIGILVANAVTELALQSVRDGISLRRWDEASLLRFETELARFDPNTQFGMGARFELAFAEKVSTDWISGKLKPEDVLGMFSDPGEDDPKPHELYQHLDFSTDAIFRLLFEGDPAKPIALPERLEEMREFAGELEPSDPESVLRSAVRSHFTVGIRSLRLQAKLDHARIAIAVERFRLEHDDLPATLAKLTPHYLTEIPADPMSGDPPIFSKRTDGSLVIYSVGWDRDDDGGESIGLQRLEDADGDWVWQVREPLQKD